MHGLGKSMLPDVPPTTRRDSVALLGELGQAPARCSWNVLCRCRRLDSGSGRAGPKPRAVNVATRELFPQYKHALGPVAGDVLALI